MVFHFSLFTFATMKRTHSIGSFLFGLIVLAAILLQSVHSFQHLEKALTEKHCYHKYALNKTEISHAHNDFEYCFTCEFTFSNTLKSDFFTFNFKKVEISTSYTYFFSKEIVNHFKGSLFALRAPPTFIV